jgi:hypothetical protein
MRIGRMGEVYSSGDVTVTVAGMQNVNPSAIEYGYSYTHEYQRGIGRSPRGWRMGAKEFEGSITLPLDVANAFERFSLSIDVRAFENSKIRSVISLGGITTLPGVQYNYTYYGVFVGCVGLKSVNLPETLTSVSRSTFRNCTSLISVTVLPTVAPTLGGADAFANNDPNRKIYVPAGSLSAYRAAAEWSTYADVILPI